MQDGTLHRAPRVRSGRGHASVVAVGAGAAARPLAGNGRQLKGGGNGSSASEVEAEALASLRASKATVYSAAALAQRYSREPFPVYGRMMKILTRLGAVGLALLADRATGKVDANMQQRAVQFRKALSDLGPTFVKMGQALSTRPDLLPPIYLDELAFLQVQSLARPHGIGMGIGTGTGTGTGMGMAMGTVIGTVGIDVAAAASCSADNRQRICAVVSRAGKGDALLCCADKLPTFSSKEAFACIEAQLGLKLEDIFEVISPEPIAAASLGQVYKARLLTGQAVAVKIQRPAIETAIGLDFYLLRGACTLVDKYVDTLTTSVVALLDDFASRVYQELNYVQEARNARRFSQLYGDRADIVVPQPFWQYTSHMVLCMDWIDGIKLSDAAAMDAAGLDVLALVDTGIQCSLRQLLEAASSMHRLMACSGCACCAVLWLVWLVPAYYALILRSLTVLEGLALYTDPNFKVLAAAYPYMAKRLLTDPNPYLRDALVELLFKDGVFRWGRLENLLQQGKKDSDYDAASALRPVLDLLLGAEGAPLRQLVEGEAVRVMEALLLGSALDTVAALPPALRAVPLASLLPVPGARMKSGEQAAMLELRDSVLQEPQAQAMGGRIAGGVLQRLAARMLLVALRPPASASPSPPPKSSEVSAAPVVVRSAPAAGRVALPAALPA
eukprot:jgi/Mesen1/3300/ME000191S02443